MPKSEKIIVRTSFERYRRQLMLSGSAFPLTIRISLKALLPSSQELEGSCEGLP
jgi:hypothetical protein